jgi:predicted phosphodiesterase
MAPKIKQPDDPATLAWEKLLQEAAEERVENEKLLAEARKNPQLAVDLKQRMVADLQRVAQVPRPIIGPSSSRQRYRELGHYNEGLVPFLFGNHQEFQRAAGLHDSRLTTKAKNRAALLHTHQQVAAYAAAELKPFVGAFDKTQGRGSLRVVMGSDWHSKQANPFARRVFMDYLRWSQPDVIVFNGDVVDFPSVASHRQLPGHFHWNMQAEVDYAEALFAEARAACPDATILWTIGNHEYRLVNYVADKASALASLRTLRFAELFGLEKHEVGLVCRSNFLAPYDKMQKRDVAENWAVLGGCYVVTHGTALGKTAAVEQMEQFKMSGTSGHTHRPQVFSGNSLGTGPLSWMSTPMMAGGAVGRDYVPGPSHWQMGFGEAVIHRGQVSQRLIIIHPTWAETSGRVWEATHEEVAADLALWQVNSK